MLEKLIVFVEEYSMEVTLEALLPKILGKIEFQIIRFQCKDDLLEKAPNRLKGYAAYLHENWKIIIVIDRDDDNCIELKNKLESIASASGLKTKSTVGNEQSFQVINRIVIEELEAWFFGDWAAVQAAYPRVDKNVPNKKAFRDPDGITGGTWEALERVLKKAKYFETGLSKLALARSIASHMNIQQNRSRSFQAFVEAVQAVIG